MRCLLVLLFAAVLTARADEPAAGRWEGSVQIPGREMTLVIDLAQENGGAWIGSVIMPDLGLKGVALGEIAVTGSSVSCLIKDALAGQGMAPPTLQGRLDGSGMFTGEFTQAGNKAPFTLRRAGEPQVEQPPQSTAITKETEGEWKGDYELFGYPRKVSLKLTNRETGGASAEFVIVGKKVNNLPVDLVTQEGDLLTINSSAAGITYEGRRRGDQIDGTYLQGPIELPLVLKRSK